MCYLIFLLPFLCKIYRNSSILLLQGNVSPRLCFSLSSPDFIAQLLFTRNLQNVCFGCVGITFMDDLILFGLADLFIMQKCPYKCEMSCINKDS